MKAAMNTAPMMAGLLLAPRSHGFRVFIGGQEFLVSVAVEQTQKEPAPNDTNGNTITAGNTTNTYDFQNHLIRSVDGSGNVTTMVYDGDGHRVSETVNGVTTKYLIADRNPTGYTQVLEEIQNGQVIRSYTIGLDIIAQTNEPQTTSHQSQFLIYDGHGSTRMLTNASGAVIERYDFDAFGILLPDANGTRAPPQTNLLYAGEYFDQVLGKYPMRNRILDVQTDRFFTRDTFEGISSDPQSLNQYLYVKADSINGIDPSGFLGLFKYSQQFGFVAHRIIEGQYQAENPGAIVGPATGILSLLKPDIFNALKGTYGEIKPLSLSGVAAGRIQMLVYDGVFGAGPPPNFTGGLGFSHETWPGLGVVRAANIVIDGYNTPIAFFNVDGLIFYTDVVGNLKDLITLTSLELVRAFIRRGLVQRTLVASAVRISGLITARTGADTLRAEGHTAVALLLATLGGGVGAII